jgi:hypothetical protein
VETNENKSDDPRWITLRISRINLGLNLVGALLAFPVMYLLDEVPGGLRLTLAVGLALSLAWDLRLILLKARDSVGAFRVYDLDPPKDSVANADSPKLGIRVRFANAKSNAAAPERDGVVLRKAFVSPWFTALRYRLPDDPAWRRWWPKVIALWPDSLDADEFRKIRVALKWK